MIRICEPSILRYHIANISDQEEKMFIKSILCDIWIILAMLIAQIQKDNIFIIVIGDLWEILAMSLIALIQARHECS